MSPIYLNTCILARLVPLLQPAQQVNLLRGERLTELFSNVETEMTMSGEKSKNNKKEITSYSDWMSQLPTELHSVPLYMLAIPGMLFKITQLMLQSY